MFLFAEFGSLEISLPKISTFPEVILTNDDIIPITVDLPAGKSTVIGIMSSLVRITSGKVEIFGSDISKDPNSAKRNIGLVPHEYNLNQFIPILETMINVATFIIVSRIGMN